MHITTGSENNGVYIPMTEPFVSDATPKPTKETYEQFQQAYEALNKSLFGGNLPNCLITLQRRKRTYGYFSAQRFGREDGISADEIALNPSHFRSRPVAEVLATLAHEMVHLWQHHFGKPGRGRYHNRQWADQMKAIGLQPTDTGEEGGKETGESVHHIVMPDGPFARAVRKLVGRSFAITWTEMPVTETVAGPEGESEEKPKEKSGKRVKYTCPRCDQKAWAKHEAKLLCGVDMAPMEAPA